MKKNEKNENDVNFVTMTFRVSPEEHRLFRMWCAANGVTSQDTLQEHVTRLGREFRAVLAESTEERR